MTSYGHGYYEYMKKQKVRAGTRAIAAMMDFRKYKKVVDLNYATQQHFNYLYYTREMERWRKNMNNIALLKKAYGARIK